MKKEFPINSTVITKIIVDLSIGSFSIEVNDSSEREQILKGLVAYKKIKARDAMLSANFTCSMTGENTILISGVGLQEALSSLKLSRYINLYQYTEMNSFINSNKTIPDYLVELLKKQNTVFFPESPTSAEMKSKSKKEMQINSSGTPLVRLSKKIEN